MLKHEHISFIVIPSHFFLDALENQQRFLAANNTAAFQSMMNQQNMAALRAAAAGQAAAGTFSGAPLILSPRLQMPPTSMANGVMNGAPGAGPPPPLIAPGDTQSLLYAQYAAAAASDYSNYHGLVSPLLTAEYAQAAAAAGDPSGGLFAR